jgi:hypothetical protein
LCRPLVVLFLIVVELARRLPLQDLGDLFADRPNVLGHAQGNSLGPDVKQLVKVVVPPIVEMWVSEDERDAPPNPVVLGVVETGQESLDRCLDVRQEGLASVVKQC